MSTATAIFNENLAAIISLNTSIDETMEAAKKPLVGLIVYSCGQASMRKLAPMNTALAKLPIRFRQSFLKAVAYWATGGYEKEKTIQVSKTWRYSRKNGIKFEALPSKTDSQKRIEALRSMDLSILRWEPKEGKQVKINFQHVRDWLETASSDKVREAFPERYLQKLETAWQEVHNKPAKASKVKKSSK